MIIRSQDKKKIFILEQTRKIDSETNMIIADDVSVMGEYSTEEKAIKVLDMIQQKYLEYVSSCGGSINQYSAIPPTAFIPPKVFQMPQDSEV